MVWNINTSCGNETSKIRYLAWQYIHGKGVDVGCGQDLVHPDAIGVDLARNGSYPVAKFCQDGQDLSNFKELDYVYSSHYLEHCHNTKDVLSSWWNALKVGGYLILYLPHKNLYPNVGQYGANPDHKHDFVPQDIIQHMNVVAAEAGNGFIVLEDEDRALDNEYSFFQVYMKTHVPEMREYKPWAIRKGNKKLAMVIRYGAFGDMIQATTLFGPLQEQGYTIHFNTGPRGADILKHDSAIEHIVINDVAGPISGGFLDPYWNEFKKRYDKVIQLTASVEDTLLLTPFNPHLYNLSDTQRRKLCGHNYREWTHEVAGLPLGAPPRVELSPAEIGTALESIAPYAGYTTALVVVRGSAHHKQLKHISPMVHRLATKHNVYVLLIADNEAKDHVQRIVDDAVRYGANPEHIKSIVGQSIRDTIALAHIVDMVIGPETGVLNAIAYQPIFKAMFLSHSSKENLCKDWVNLCAITPGDLPCYPCHRLHYGPSHCNMDKDGFAKCTAHDVSIVDAIMVEYKAQREREAKAKKEQELAQQALPSNRG